MHPTITKLSYTYKKQNSDVRVLNRDDIPVPLIQTTDNQIIYVGPQSIGGNHKHPRTEWFVAFGQLVFFWLDEKGEINQEPMNPNSDLLLFYVPPFLPHAIKNVSENSFGILYELADAKMEHVEPIPVIPQ